MKNLGLKFLVVQGVLRHFEIVTRRYVLNSFKYSQIYIL